MDIFVETVKGDVMPSRVRIALNGRGIGARKGGMVYQFLREEYRNTAGRDPRRDGLDGQTVQEHAAFILLPRWKQAQIIFHALFYQRNPRRLKLLITRERRALRTKKSNWAKFLRLKPRKKVRLRVIRFVPVPPVARTLSLGQMLEDLQPQIRHSFVTSATSPEFYVGDVF